MAPSKTPRVANEDVKIELVTNSKDKAAQPQNQQSNGKLRRATSSTGANLRESTTAVTAPAPPTPATGAVAQEQPATPGLQWPAFERKVLHAYRRAYRLNTPTSFSSDYRQWVLSRPGSIGLHSPTMARRKEFRRQSNDQLANTVRKHFNGLGVQENDIIVDFLHKIRTQAITKSSRVKRAGNALQEQ